MPFVLPGQSGSNFGMAPGATGGGAAPAAPVIISPLTHTSPQGAPFSYWITATGMPTSYNATGLPAGLTVNTATGQISGTPPTAATTNVTISATNSLGTDSQTLAITIAVARPVVTGGTLSGVVNIAITPYQIVAINNPTSYAVNPALPANLTLNTATGEITGTPLASGNTPIQITATNAGGTSVPATLNVNIAAALPAAPVITAGQSISGTAGSAITPYTVQNTGGTATNWSATGLPTNLTINASTGVISGIPSTATGSPFTANITATNAGGSSGPVPLTVTVAPAAAQVPSITSALTYRIAPSGTVNYQITASNGPITAYAATGLPSGVTVNTTSGLISGTAPATLGDTNVTLTATNATGTSAPATLVFTVAAGWEITNTLPANVTVISTGATTTALGPLPNWTGWQSSYQADMTDALYDAPTPAAQTVRLFATLAGTGEVEVPFDNFTNPTTSANPGIRQWGYNSSSTTGGMVPNTVYLDGGQNSSLQAIPLRLVKS